MKLFLTSFRVTWGIILPLFLFLCVLLVNSSSDAGTSGRRAASLTSPATGKVSVPEVSGNKVESPLKASSNKSSAQAAKHWRKVASHKMLVTAYCPCKTCCGPGAVGRTSTGRDAYRYSGVAAAPQAIPYGAWVSIPGVGFREVDDTGGAMRQSWRSKGIYHLDLRFRDHEEARQWGRKWLAVDLYSSN